MKRPGAHRVCETFVNSHLMDQLTEQLTYESAFTELQQIVQELQGEMVGIDDLALKIARAQELIRFCRERLREVETEVGKIVE